MKNEPQEAISVSDEARELQSRKEAGPHVGLFYVVSGELHWEGIPVENAKSTPHAKIYPKNFTSYWEHLVRLEPRLGKYDPSHFPRGRVMFSTQEGIYRLLADNCIVENSELVKRIASEMKLPATEVKISWDINCECAECKSNHDDTELGINVLFKITKDGRKLFFPWGSLGRGYLIPSEQEYQRLRKGHRLWLKIGLPLTVSMGVLAIHITEFLTGSFYMGLVMLWDCGLLLFCVPFSVWNWKQYRGMERIDESSE